MLDESINDFFEDCVYGLKLDPPELKKIQNS